MSPAAPHLLDDASESALLTDAGPDLRAVFDAMAELVIVRGADGRLTDVNAAFIRAFGGERSDWTGAWFAVAPAFGEDGGARRYDVAMRTRAGPVWIEWSETPLPGGGAVATGRDVTEQREAALRQDERAKGKTTFFAAVTHELRTPLSGALGTARLLEDTDLAPDQAAYVTALTSSARHALALVDDILDLSRLEAGRLELRPEPVEPGRLVEEVCELLAEKAAEKGLTLAHAESADVPARIRADPARLKQILFNLAGNAVKFTEAGGVLISLETEKDGALRLSVRDTGPGISAADQSRLFEHFERGAAEKGSAPGAGLGLAMVKRLAEAMGGEVGVRSKPDEGALFWVRITPETVQRAPARRPLAGRRVLIATPCPIEAEALRLQAEALGAYAEACLDRDRIVAEARAAGAASVILDDVWADEAAAVRQAATVDRILALARPRTKARYADGERPAEIDGWLVAPVRANSLARFVLGQARGEEERAGPAALESLTLTGLAVLVAEDDPVNAMIARTVLTRLGADVTLVTNGAKAVDVASEGGVDAALLDLRMPEMDGREAARRIRDLPGPPGAIPIIALTANATEADRDACLAAGMDGFLPKPLDPAALSDVLTALCGRENRASLTG
ncbi:response regulator [Glycocaulis profundi]|nr:response regulator [Glycocaulis profundi]